MDKADTDIPGGLTGQNDMNKFLLIIAFICLSGCCVTHNAHTGETKIEPMHISKVKVKAEMEVKGTDDLTDRIYIESNFFRVKF